MTGKSWTAGRPRRAYSWILRRTFETGMSASYLDIGDGERCSQAETNTVGDAMTGKAG